MKNKMLIIVMENNNFVFRIKYVWMFDDDSEL